MSTEAHPESEAHSVTARARTRETVLIMRTALSENGKSLTGHEFEAAKIDDHLIREDNEATTSTLLENAP